MNAGSAQPTGRTQPYLFSRLLADEGPFRTHHAELVAFRVGEDGPGLGAALPDIHRPGTEGKDALDLGLLLAKIGAQVEVEAI